MDSPIASVPLRSTGESQALGTRLRANPENYAVTHASPFVNSSLTRETGLTDIKASSEASRQQHLPETQVFEL